MKPARASINLLIAEDDLEDRMLLQDALTESRLANELRFVSDGEELLEYLRHEGRYASAPAAPRPPYCPEPFGATGGAVSSRRPGMWSGRPLGGRLDFIG